MTQNPYVLEFVDRLRSRFSDDSSAMSMGDWLCANTKLRGRPFSFDRYPFQKTIVDDMHPNMDVIKPSQVGLALALDTPVPTLTGWTTMGEVAVGDVLFDEQGQPTPVLYVSPVYQDHECFTLTFDTGEQIVADADHRWYVKCAKAFNPTGLYPSNGRIPVGSDYARTGIIATKVLAEIGFTKDRNLFAIPVTKPLEAPHVDLPLDPYFLGLWLGDGSSHSATLTSSAVDYPEHAKTLRALGFTVSPQKGTSFSVDLPTGVKRHRLHDYNPETAKVYGVLKHLGVLKNKHVPQEYLRASASQRGALLQGLLDTDGSITPSGRISFHNTNIQLVEGFEELAASLGFKTRTRWRSPQESATMKCGQVITPKQAIAEVSFVSYSDQILFQLPRKQARVKNRAVGRASESFRRRIVSVEPTPSVPVRCISVSSPSHLFLAGRGMIPTHNTEVQIRKSLAFLARTRGTSLIFTLPNDQMFERTSATRILPLAKEEKVFNLDTENGDKPIRSKSLIQVGTSFLYITGAKEGDATSIPADAVFNDEVDLTDQQMLALFSSRMQNSDFRINQRFSTPTFVNFGIDAGYQASDQHRYLVKCDACQHWQEPTFTEKSIELPGLPSDMPLLEIDTPLIDSGRLHLDQSYVCCESCRAPLDLSRWDNREWVAKYPTRSHHRGYRVSPFSTDRLSVAYVITEMLKYNQKNFIRGWHNTVLGQPYTAGSARLGDADINPCFTPVTTTTPDRSRATWIGIDMGAACHIVVAQGDSKESLDVVRFLVVPVAQLNDTVTELLQTYNVIGGAVDRHPYTPSADALFVLSEGKIMPVEYRGTHMVNPVGDPPTHVQANRTAFLDEIPRLIRLQRIRFSGYGVLKSVITEHLKDMVRDETPEKPAVWVKLTGNDHFFHALGFAVYSIDLATALLGEEDPRSTVVVQTANLQTESLRRKP
jgi:hypothetical protein